ncbi:acetyl-CoA hydrolase/transferase C-terminal domain-containing protein [Hydrocarboniphaga sp.]|uniref:acetyl-CoA hydrolase/transferase C-terminal domain-containing protein n=1 Tax=Hydrocarboniphaga sp. TaxID=2033016 RepID=UPI003D109020
MIDANASADAEKAQPEIFAGIDACVDAILQRIGFDVRLGVPLGLGKPVELINALYDRARRDPSMRLTILTALSLERPHPKGLEAALLNPFLDRVFDGVPQLQYALDQSAGRLPPNVRIVEFFIAPGSRLNNAQAQRDYISTNYTFAARDVYEQGCNIAAQMIAKRDTPEGLRYSLSCNPDTGPELVRMLRAAQARGERKVAVVGMVNQSLPYMARDAEVPPSTFDFVLDDAQYTRPLFSTPKTPVVSADHAIGLQASALVRDGGTLQIGIGSLGDAIVSSLILRHRDNAAYRSALEAIGIVEEHAELIRRFGGVDAFQRGLYGASEMFVDGFWELIKAGVLTREVYDFWALQELVDEGRCDPSALKPELLDELVARGVRLLRTQDYRRLQNHGFFADGTRYEDGRLVAPDGTRINANLADPEARAQMAARCLGKALRNSVVMHGGFFLGPRSFYRALNELTQEQRDRICMTGVERVNQLDLDPRLYMAQRLHARFINTGMMATLSGAVISDGLADGRVVSGVGGQYNFVAQAHQLPTGRSILLVRAVRDAGGVASSNIVFNYGHCTIPRHLRDIVITEYGIADLRAKTDADVAKAMINVADSRFQAQLLAQAQKAGKIEAGYAIPDRYRGNTPERLVRVFDPRAAVFPAFPFGHEFTEQELRIAKGLKAVAARVAKTPKWKLLLIAAKPVVKVDAAVGEDLQRVGLLAPDGIENRVARALLIGELRRA